jgi:hypothetical protein
MVKVYAMRRTVGVGLRGKLWRVARRKIETLMWARHLKQKSVKAVASASVFFVEQVFLVTLM